MLIDTQYLSRSKNLLVSYINAEGKTKLEYFPWEHTFKYEACSENDKDRDLNYRSWDNKPIKKVIGKYPDRYATYEFLDSLPKEKTKEIFAFYLPKTFFIDLEVAQPKNGGFPDPKEADGMIQSISVVFDDKVLLLGLKDLSEEAIEKMKKDTNKYFKDFDADYKFKYVKFKDEFDMIHTFFNKHLPDMPCITGWNFLDFDLRYLINRARKLSKTKNGKTFNIDPRVASCTRTITEVWGTDYEMPKHKLVFDYMLLYDSLDTSIKVKESKSLDFVSENLLGVKKIDYNGSLMKLYEEDFEKFMYYNAVDSILVQKIHEKGRYIDIIFAIASLARIKAVDVYSYMNGALGSLAITEGVLRDLFRDEESVVFFKDHSKSTEKGKGIAGGWVKPPAVGMNRWVACYDFASLYPSVQRQYFISPENYLGKKNAMGYGITDSGDQFNIDESMVVCVNDCIFKKRKSPTIKMLENVYAERKKNKKIMMSKKVERDELIKELEMLENKI